MSELRLGIAGLGTVAQGVLHLLAANADRMQRRAGRRLRVSRVVSRTPKPEIDLLGATFSTELDDLLAEDVDLVIELIGGEEPARTLIENAISAGKPVVTANKAVVARYGNDLLPASQLKFEASVAGAIPIVAALEQALVANEVSQVVGIINGTCNYILTSMQSEGAAFADALQRAQELGYAEADPTFDIDGIDAAHKLTILASLAFDCALNFDAVYIEGIRQIDAQDIRFAQELGYAIKHVGIVKASDQGEIEARVHPALIAEDELLANVNDVANAVLVSSDGAGQTLFSGPGAGSTATASAVLADVVALALAPPPIDRALIPARYVAIDHVVCPNYLRIPVVDQAGVFAQIANALSERGISIEAAIQKEPQRSGDVVSIVILTGSCTGSDLNAALQDVQEIEYIAGDIARIRVETMG